MINKAEVYMKRHTEYRYLLMDLDDTLLDWHETERQALREVFQTEYNRSLTDGEIRCYNQINALCWKQLERREITKEQLKAKRFREFLKELGAVADDATVIRVNDAYMRRLSRTVVELPDAGRVCEELSKRYEIILITNGTDWVQRGRLAGVSFRELLRGIVISDEVGCNKPAPEFFRGVIAITGDADPSHYLVIGDSQSSDIGFGRAIGADTMWVHMRDDGQNGEATYTVQSLAEAAELLL